MLLSKKILDQVAYYLIIHDLTDPKPYRKASKLLNQLNNSAKLHALKTFTDLYNRRESLSLFDADQKGLNALLASMHYDGQSIQNNLTVYRVQNSDFIDVEFTSENSELSAVVANQICKEFIDYYSFLVKENQRKAVDFWGSLLQAKGDTLNKRMEVLKSYKIQNHVLNLNEKATSIYGQITDYEAKKEELEKNVQSTQAAINDIDKQFNPNDRRYMESTQIAGSQQILTARAQLNELNNEYVQNNFDPQYKKQIDSLSDVITSLVGKQNDKYILNPLNAKQSLVQEKLTLQVDNDLAKNSMGAVNQELTRLYKEFDSLVPREGTIQAMESAISVASQEYLEVLAKYNQTNVGSKLSVQLRIMETAQPGAAQPSKKMLLIIISGVISAIFCVVVFFIMFFFDSSVKSSRELANRTKLPVLGHVNLLKSKSIDLREVWINVDTLGETKQFRNLMQSIRFEVDNELGKNKVLLINSITKGEGKTFVALNLAYAYSTINKNVLLIDGNFINPGITEFAKSKYYLEDFLSGDIDPSFLLNKSKIKILGNKGKDISLLEIRADNQIAKKFGLLKSEFDIIIIEASPLDTLNKSKEWVNFSDKVLTVFESGQNISEPMKHQIEYLKNANGKFIGWVLNLEKSEFQVDESA